MTRPGPAEDWDVLHEDIGDRALWTRVNIAEACPGVPTPLTWSWFGPASDVGVSRGWVELGVLPAGRGRRQERVADRMVAIHAGRPVLNLGILREIGDSIPGNDGNKVEQQLFSSGAVHGPVHPHRRRYPAVAAKLVPAVLAARRQLLSQVPRTEAWYTASIAVLSGQVDAARARALLTESFERYRALTTAQTVNSLSVSGAYDLLHRLCVRYDLADQAGALSTSDEATPESATVADLWRLSRDEINLATFLRRHGYHAPVQGELAVPSWRVDPTPVVRLAETYRRRPVEESPAVGHQELRARREDSRRLLLRRVPPPARMAVRLLLTLVRRMVPLREVARLQFMQCADVARASADVLGRQLVASGRLESARDVFYLTLDELVADQPVTAALVARRRARRQEYRRLELPMRFRGYPEITELCTPDRTGRRLTGLPGSPGIHEGLARVIVNPDDADALDHGEILVCETTNPSWASYFLVAGAVVVDIGGPLSHGAIVAREMGIPCVINTRTAHLVIHSGDRIRVNGTTGLVEILAAAANARQESGFPDVERP
ncbi:MAG TPA: PEP-utilizing enzyme [Pseudonocardia sp.]|jgi:pyruvate,water dikinase